MEKIKASLGYILTFQGIAVIGGKKQYYLNKKCHSIIGIQYEDKFIDIKTKEIYPILHFDFEGNICNDIVSDVCYACLEEGFLNEIGIYPSLTILEEDQELLEDKIKDTVLYIDKEKSKKKVISYDTFMKKRKHCQSQEKK